ncbi:sulfur-oxidizing protein SoxY [Tistlia consotensis]|uniref:Sulfur-oxidizing protein SoxY n=1 Tax=Tistlia consotensis USBA 355 TaxID=560819 RepID=A0A1Y6CUF6_9PROT|nr:quinoprotein dehydrogenase-associated SoxYZ-like carrier [Tistlia consotensis]SMF80283.1 sulfur-oxidizing protein SoxY [Tistlia consotensis USBA 355]SNR62417.1 sulfur-oxidizing protein SoxY [Tistlia consotensis]
MSRSLSSALHRLFPALAVAGAVGASAVPALAADDDAWTDLRPMLFGERPISEAPGVVSLDAPYRAQDAAIVPITIEAKIPQTPERYIKTVTLVIDQNPVPVAAVFHLTPRIGLATLATRVRVNSYSNVRAIAETNDGALFMATKFVKATGGCSAPALKDQDAALARLGKMKLKPMKDEAVPGLRRVQLLISHPNNSGLQMDQITHLYVPPHYVTDIAVDYGDRTLMTVEGAISLSEDPSIHFYYRPDGADRMAVTVKDSENMTFEGSWPVAADAGS